MLFYLLLLDLQNPVTTGINELVQDSTSGVTTVAEANLKTPIFGMEAVTSAGIDFTKFDQFQKRRFQMMEQVRPLPITT